MRAKKAVLTSKFLKRMPKTTTLLSSFSFRFETICSFFCLVMAFVTYAWQDWLVLVSALSSGRLAMSDNTDLKAATGNTAGSNWLCPLSH